MQRDDVFPSRWLKASDFPRPKALKVDGVTMETLKGADGVTQKKPAITFVGTTKALICNRINFDTIVHLTGQFDTDEWPGTVIELYADRTQMGAKTVDCVRVRAPTAKTATAKVKKPEPEADGEFGESENPEPHIDDEEVPF